MKIQERAEIIRQRVHELSKLDPFVICRLQGVEFKLEFDNNAIKTVLSETGLNILAEGGIPREYFGDPDKVGALFFYGVQKHHGEEQAGRTAQTHDYVRPSNQPPVIISMKDLDCYLGARHHGYILRCLHEATEAFFPDISDLPKLKEDGSIEDSEDPQ